MTVTKGTLGCRLCHLSTHSGMCCISGCTLMMMSGSYFMIPATTSLYPFAIASITITQNMFDREG